MNKKLFLIKEHLTSYGLTLVKDDSYIKWAYKELYKKKLAKTKIQKLFLLRKKMKNSTYKNKLIFYKFVSQEKEFLKVIHSYKFNAILYSCYNIINEISECNNLLDFGCNSGYLTSFYSKYFYNANVVGFDICVNSIKQANLIAKKYNNLKFISKYNKLTDNFYDVLFDTQCLATINNKLVLRKALSEVYKKTKKTVKIISISPFNTEKEINDFIYEMNNFNFYLTKYQPIFFDSYLDKEVLTKFIFEKQNIKCRFSPQKYFEGIRKRLNTYDQVEN